MGSKSRSKTWTARSPRSGGGPVHAGGRLVTHVGMIAEIPNSLRLGTPVTLDRVSVSG
ncbi:MAG TPA: hypothetical protein VG268_19175 [Streptosporangiaceae bacterium]|nr:hypothetical protein [Streptosporangiaceae bacterium]